MAVAGARENTELDETTFVALRRLVHEQSGIFLKEEKKVLVATRLAKRIRELGLPSYKSYLQRLREDRDGGEMTVFLDSISTNVTSFYREADHFDVVRMAYSEWKAAGQRRFRFWSAASSSGEEPYTLALTLLEAGTDGCDVKILGTDISTRILKRAMAGRYPKRVVEPVPSALRSRYFVADGDHMVVTDKVRSMVSYRHANLSKLPTPVKGPIDIVFCRNVMIYFEDELRRRLVQEFVRVLRPGGYLIIGHSESLVGMQDGLTVVRPSVYRKPE